MATDREFSVILKATDLSTQPINQIVEALRKLTEAQKANNEAAAKGAITAKDFKDNLETAKSAAGGLAGAITVLQRVQDQMARTAKQGEALADMRAKLNAKQAETPPDAEPTEKQTAAVKRLEASVASLQKRYEQGNATLETYIATLEKMGVAADLSDKMGTRLLREREKATQAAIAAQEKLNAKIAAAPEEGERTKAQEYSIRRLVTALEAAQSRAQQAQVALQNYEGIKLNEAIVQQQVRLREELTAVEPVIARANVETLSLTENRRKAAEAATAQADAEKLLATQAKAAAEAEDKYNAEFAARQRAQRQAETGRFAKGGEVDVSSATAAAASEISLRNIRQSAFQDALRDQEQQQAAAKAARERDAAEDAAFVARKRAEAKATSAAQIEIDRSSAAAAAANELSLRNARRSAFEEAVADQEQRVAAGKAAHAAEDADNKAFVERQRAEAKAASAAQIEIDKSSAAAAAANGLSLRNVRRAAFEEAVADHEQQQAAAKSAREREAAEDAAFIAQQRAQRQTETSRFTKGGEVDVSSAAAAAANELSLRNVRRSAFEEAIAEQEQRVAAEKAAHAAEDADNKAFVERQRAANKERIEADQKLLAEQQRVNDERANMRRFDFQEAVEAQAKEEVLAQQRAAAAKEQQKRLEQLLESQEKITRAQAAIPGTLPSGAVPQAPRDFSQSITAILAPAQAARETLGGIEKQVDAIAVGMQAAKLRSEDYDKILRDLGATFGALQRQANLVESFRQQEQAISRLLAELTKEQSTLQALNASYAQAKAYDEAQVRTILDQTNKVKGLTTAFNAQNETFSQVKAAAQAAGIDINHLAASETRITDAALRASEVLRTANAATGRGNEFTFLGLRPYELQNLSYQINDVFTQLASGTSVTQTLSQQGGQIFQLFQKQIVSAVAALKEIPFALTGIGVALATVTVAVLAFARALDLAAAQRKFMSESALDVDNLGASAPKLLKVVEAAERLGVAFADAAKGVNELQRAGFSDAQIARYSDLVAKLSVARGVPMADVVKSFTSALRGGYEEMHKFSLEFARLTAEEDDRIRKLLEAGKADEARAALVEATQGRAQKAYDVTQTTFRQSSQKIINAWHDLQATIADEGTVTKWNNFWATVIRGGENVIKVIQGIGRALEALGPTSSSFGLPSFGGGGGGGAVDKDLAVRQATVMQNLMRDLQLTREQASGLVGQLSHESGIQAIQEANPVGGGPGGFGWAQWTGVRRKAFEDFAKQNNLDMKSEAANYGFLLHELRTTHADVLEDIRKQTTVAGATTAAFRYESGAAAGKEDPRMIKAPESRLRFAQAAFAGSAQAQEAAKATEETNRAIEATRNWERAEEERRTEAEKGQGAALEQLKNLDERVEIARRRVLERAQKVGVTEGTDVNREAIRRQQDKEEQRLRDEFLKAQQAGEVEAESQLEETRQRILKADKTNLDQRLQANQEYYDKLRTMISQREREGKGAPRGMTYEQWLAEINQIQEQERQTITADTAQNIVDAAVSRQKTQFEQLEQLRANGIARGPELVRQLKEIGEASRQVVEAIKQADIYLSRLPQTAAIQAQREKLRAAQQEAEQRPRQARDLVGRAIQQEGESFRVVGETRDDRLEALNSLVRAGRVEFAEGLKRGIQIINETRPVLQKAVDEAKSNLAALGPEADARQRAAIEKLVAEAEVRLNKADEGFQKLIEAGLQTAAEALGRDQETFDRKKNEIYKDMTSGIISAVDAQKQLVKLLEQYGPQITKDAAELRRRAEQVRQLPSDLLRPETRATADQALSRADTAARDVRVAPIDLTQKAAADGLRRLGDLRIILSEKIRENNALEKIGAQTAEESEEKRADATRSVQKEGEAVLINLQAQIEALEKIGGHALEIAKLRAAMAEFRAETIYATKFQMELVKTIEGTVVNHAVQAFDTMAESLGKLIVHGGKLKDVWSSLGQAFAQFTSGVLRDIAQMIIKFYVLRAVQGIMGAFGTGSLGAVGTVGSGTALSESILSAGTSTGGTIVGHTAGAFVGVSHSGGIVGGSGMSRVVDLSVFRDAQRFHNGGMVLRRDEIPIIAQRGEKIVSLAQQRTDAAQKAAQAAQAAQNGASIRNVLAVGDKEIASAMNSSHGEKVVLNVLQRNAPTVKKWVG